MKRSGFKKLTYAEAIAKQEAQRKKYRAKFPRSIRKKTSAKKKRKKLPAIKTLRNKTDALLTPIIKKKYPKCMLCPFMTPARGSETQVAHHHVHKSKSTALRYELDNLIPLCNPCHQALHHNESYWASVIVKMKGIEWFNGLEVKKNAIIKVDRFFYQENYNRLKEILDNL